MSSEIGAAGTRRIRVHPGKSHARRGRHQRRARLYAAKIHREDIEMVGGGAERDRARRGMSSPGNSRRTGRGNDNPAEGFPLRSAAFQIFASRSEEHTSELQSLMRISYAVFCLKKKKT